MSAFVYDDAMSKVASGSINLANDTFKLMLVTSSYSASKADASVTAAAAAEVAATNYAGGFGGSGRKSAPRSIVKDTTNNVVRMIFSADVTWTALGGASNATVAAAVLIKEVASDAGSTPVAYFPLASPVTTNGSDFKLTVDGALGNVTFTL